MMEEIMCNYFVEIDNYLVKTLKIYATVFKVLI